VEQLGPAQLSRCSGPSEADDWKTVDKSIRFVGESKSGATCESGIFRISELTPIKPMKKKNCTLSVPMFINSIK